MTVRGWPVGMSRHAGPAVLQGIDAHTEVESLGGWSVVGGDFNQSPSETVTVCGTCAPQSSALTWAQTHAEAAQLDPTYHTLDGTINQKFDYIWSGNIWSGLRTKTPCFAIVNGSGQRVSDHRYCRGQFTFD